jgi:hypothetical protein
MIRVIVAILLVTSLTPPLLLARQGGDGVPSLAYIEASGCEGLFLYAWNAARTEVLTVRVDRSRVALADGATTFNLMTAGDAVAVRIELTGARRETMPYCSESGQASGDRPSIWLVKGGTLKVMFRRRAAAPVTPVSVMLDDLVLVSPDGVATRGRRTVRFTAAIAELAP